jgi:hypothetical protein
MAFLSLRHRSPSPYVGRTGERWHPQAFPTTF